MSQTLISKVRQGMSDTYALQWGAPVLFGDTPWDSKEPLLNFLAVSLGGTNRFGGRSLVNVAQHSIETARIVRGSGGGRKAVRYALLHDAAEAFLGDISRPMKQFMDEYATVEALTLREVLTALGVPAPPRAIAMLVKNADDIACATEIKSFEGDVKVLPRDAAAAAWLKEYNDNEQS